jgi:RimJ/RimL family protein N-acetyltransferase
MSLQAGTQPRDVPVFMPMTLEIDWLNIDRRTLFLLTADGRIERENDPEHSPGPRFWLARCQEGNVFGIRADFPDDGAAELEAIATTEPSFTRSVTSPRHLDRYAELVARACGVARRTFGLIYELPHSPRYESHAQLIGSDSEEGQRFGQSLSERGMPRGVSELGFRSVADLWPPWCAAVVDGEIASIAFAARLSDVGAELGVVTVRAFRGRGLAAAATAGWSSLPSLQSRVLFYTTDQGNISSQRAAKRLGLQLRGASLRIS